MRLGSENAVRTAVRRAVESTPVLDMHTHLFEPRFGSLLLWGIDELLTYHYLVAEVFRARPDVGYSKFWAMTKKSQAELVWQELFVKRSPVSEAARGVSTCLQAIGVRPGPKGLLDARRKLSGEKAEKHVERVFRLAGVSQVVMTNDPFDDDERGQWLKSKAPRDGRFLGALRLDALLNAWPAATRKLAAMGYRASGGALGPDGQGAREVRRFLDDWRARVEPVYLAASLPPDFVYPEASPRGNVLSKCILPWAHETGLPVALMIGVRKLVNPELRLAGDSVGPAHLETLEALCRDWPDVRFLVTLLARENQHGLCVAARKFPNLIPFGCWWFLNDPSIIREMTAQRLELLGLSFVPQHSDARVLDQLIYKWRHSRQVIGEVLSDKFADLWRAGWPVGRTEIQRDVERLLAGNFRELAGRPRK